MNVWMTPEGEPFFGGTYFPPDDRTGRPGFPSVIRRVAEEWKSSEVQIRAHGEKVIDALRSSAAPPASEASEDILRSAYEEFVRNYDPEWGGFGTGEQFPRASVFNFLLRLHATTPASPEGKAALEMTRNTLHKMASGGIRDHIGGGFHRYAVDRAWRVLHFEKMLCDQAQLAVSYCEAWQVTGDPLFLDVARGTLEYVLRELTHPEEGFSQPRTPRALSHTAAPDKPKARSICGPPLRLAMRLALRRREYSPFTTVCNPWEMCPMPTTRAANFEAGTSLSNASPSQNPPATGSYRGCGRAVAGLQQRKAFRPSRQQAASRPRRKVLRRLEWSHDFRFAQVGVALNDARYARAAASAARFVRNRLYDAKTEPAPILEGGDRPDSGLRGSYAFLIQALLDLYQASADSQALDWAIALQGKQDEFFWDATSGGYFESSAEDQLVKVRLKQDHDGAEPSANSVSALNLLRLSRMLHEEHYAKRAKDISSTFSAASQNAPATAPQMLAALQFSRSKPRQAVIAGDPQQQATRLLVHSILRDFHPDLVVLYARDANALSGDAAQALAAMRPIQGRPALYLCENFTCRAPVTSPEDARRLLDRIRVEKSLD